MSVQSKNDNTKLSPCLLCGGQSTEHQISLLSAVSVFSALDKEKYDISIICITRNGTLHYGKDTGVFMHPENAGTIGINTESEVIEVIKINDEVVLRNFLHNKILAQVDVFFPLIHGTTGEDGVLQGYLELLGATYVGSGVTGSAICMDKDISKRLLRDAGLPIARYTTLRRHNHFLHDVKEVKKLVGEFPLFVKPASLGSSVGISKAHNEDELSTAIKNAMEFDTKVLVEEGIECREIELAVLGGSTPKCSVPGEVLSANEFYDYEAKYLKPSEIKIPADLPVHKIKELQTLATQAFTVLECNGLARVDFFYTKEQKIYINEVNTIPGFTQTSMYPKLWEASGVTYTRLLDTLIELALDKRK